MTKPHSFHIPVMGIGFTIDTPLKVSQYGIDSVISLVDDILIERMRKLYCDKNELPYEEITEKKSVDFRAERITSYLNLIQKLASDKFTELKESTLEKSEELNKYFSMLPSTSELKKEFENFTTAHFNTAEIKEWLKTNLTMGSIDVNIMTKVDKDNYRDKEQLPSEYNDAHAALRGFANSDLQSNIILSAGMNPRLFGYMENFADFYPNERGDIKKKIVLKVSDYRSALIQGKFLAKKGLWVSEFRIESGLNCGGHAFATDGSLMGPILAEFRDKKTALNTALFEILTQALDAKNYPAPTSLPIKISAQGGVGTNEEHEFLLQHYQVDSVGWGTPFLLVPEVVNVDEKTLKQLEDAKEEDLFLSGISPLGVPFNNLRNNTKDQEKQLYIDKGRPGSSCPKKFVAFNKDFVDTGICTSSRQYQHLKIRELDEQDLPKDTYDRKYNEIVEKSCTCVGLGTTALLVNNLDTKIEGEGVSICPGPNMAYYSQRMTLPEIVDHIYNRSNFLSRPDRPNMFIKELNVYLDYFKNQIAKACLEMNAKQEKNLKSYAANIDEGINYYNKLYSTTKEISEKTKAHILAELKRSKKYLQTLSADVEKLVVGL